MTRSINGEVTHQTTDGTVTNDYFYDNVGRLAGVHTGPNQVEYVFGSAITGCPTGQTNPGANTNRTRKIATGLPDVTYCYDNADRLRSYSANTSPITYDSHGNMLSIDGQTMSYDSSDRHLSTTSAPPATPATVSYVRDATDRIVARKLNGTTQSQYISAGGGDAPDGTLAANGTLTELTTSMPGGALLTVTAAAQTCSLPNIHGDVTATTDASGVKQGATFIYDAYGNAIGALPDNSVGNLDYGWLGKHQRPLEHQPGLAPMIEMGARQYHPGLDGSSRSTPSRAAPLTTTTMSMATPSMTSTLLACGAGRTSRNGERTDPRVLGTVLRRSERWLSSAVTVRGFPAESAPHVGRRQPSGPWSTDSMPKRLQWQSEPHFLTSVVNTRENWRSSILATLAESKGG